MESKGYKAIQAVGKDDGAFDAWKGKTGIDGIYTDRKGNYLIVESKTTGGIKPGDPDGCVGKLCTVSGGERQMSNKWIMDRLGDLPDTDRTAIEAQLRAGTLTRVYAKTDGNGRTTFNEIHSDPPSRDTDPDSQNVKIGKPWNP